jgi:protein TonB
MLIFTFSGTAVLLGLGGLCLLVGLTVLVLRKRLRKETTINGKRVKHAAFSFSKPLHRLSLCVAIMASILTINWTEFTPKTPILSYNMDEEDILEVDVPITLQEPPPPPPPPPPVIEAVAEPEIEPEVFLNQDIEPNDPIITNLAPPTPVAPAAPPPPPPLPTPEPVIDNGPVIFAERMPVFGEECYGLSSDERRICSDRALLTFVQSRVGYPALARENGIQGTVVVSFTVEKDGSISDVEAVREVAGGCTAAALKAVNAINEEKERFKPGIQGGLPVRVRFNLPVKFSLQ